MGFARLWFGGLFASALLCIAVQGADADEIDDFIRNNAPALREKIKDFDFPKARIKAEERVGVEFIKREKDYLPNYTKWHYGQPRADKTHLAGLCAAIPAQLDTYLFSGFDGEVNAIWRTLRSTLKSQLAAMIDAEIEAALARENKNSGFFRRLLPWKSKWYKALEKSVSLAQNAKINRIEQRFNPPQIRHGAWVFDKMNDRALGIKNDHHDMGNWFQNSWKIWIDFVHRKLHSHRHDGLCAIVINETEMSLEQIMSPALKQYSDFYVRRLKKQGRAANKRLPPRELSAKPSPLPWRCKVPFAKKIFPLCIIADAQMRVAP